MARQFDNKYQINISNVYEGKILKGHIFLNKSNSFGS